MTESSSKNLSVDEVTTSVSKVQLHNDATINNGEKNSLKKSFGANAGAGNNCELSQQFPAESNLQLGGNPIGNLNLPHIQNISQTTSTGSASDENSKNNVQPITSHTIEKTGNHSSLEDLEILSTIGKFCKWRNNGIVWLNYLFCYMVWFAI